MQSKPFISIEIPNGNTQAIGAFAECLSVKEHGNAANKSYNILGR